MKNTAFIALALFFGAVANAQTTTTPSQTLPVTDTAAQSATLVDTSIGKAYVSHPERLQGVTSETLTAAQIFPALGSYKGSGTSTTDVTISLDSANKGIVWVEGLTQGRFKALMKKAPATYKIPAQTSDNGKAISEGTLYLNPDTNELTIVLGRPYNDANPGAFQTVASKKSKVFQYTGVKADATAAAPATPQQ